MDEFVTFKEFSDEEHFIEFSQFLEQNNIRFQTEISNGAIDPVSMRSVQKFFLVKIEKENFPSVQKLIDNIAQESIEDIDPEHYLFQFSDEELFEILSKADEWSELDYKLAQKILQDRGHTVDTEYLKYLKKERLATLAKPEPSQAKFIWAGYTFAILGGVLGVAMGWGIYFSQKRLPNGEVVYSYSESDRKHGKKIIVIGFIMMVLLILLKILPLSSE
ncbi:hypothetical protein QM480_07255 [Flectobacillus sp. DC10W]|jgi:hypothetical protein|uniref:DUF2007 domain-containing protein n=1 Tax=Flectobacillus longus TaxID=2984207 RepID=A0ABT6YKZ5_9BACT|nr:hypothetical protein [Flectobacillus longus]MDI9864114.1 hypothetical protein [Flectobacillus longus]